MNAVFYNATSSYAQASFALLPQLGFRLYAVTKEMSVVQKAMTESDIPFGWFIPVYNDPKEKIRTKFLVQDALDQFASFELVIYLIERENEVAEALELFSAIDPILIEQSRGVHLFLIEENFYSSVEKSLKDLNLEDPRYELLVLDESVSLQERIESVLPKI